MNDKTFNIRHFILNAYCRFFVTFIKKTNEVTNFILCTIYIYISISISIYIYIYTSRGLVVGGHIFGVDVDVDEYFATLQNQIRHFE